MDKRKFILKIIYNVWKSLLQIPSDKSEYMSHRKQRWIQSKLHNVNRMEQSKLALKPYNDKRYLVSNKYNSIGNIIQVNT